MRLRIGKYVKKFYVTLYLFITIRAARARSAEEQRELIGPGPARRGAERSGGGRGGINKFRGSTR